ncbi:16S rRNA (guanine(527)-N(7))-methyltransferase RsmG [Bellilinea sp.]|jgi:16S rRNA (guanine527-N7)-methyltransferase|uniref:Ribosomal RNA small subunit methyltransferase G n=1 Tax=Bellilinea caldifistulae TaxID=360411 RepID=A0A7C4L0X5_9CHLR|nr:16S rRNA (guanine(527)-N(7))-methyltransferase RsmG [Bellilinea sp.]
MEKWVKDLKALVGIQLTARQIAAFQRYEDELLEWNSRMNLTAIRDREGIRTKHFLDSLSCILAFRERPPERLIDIGTGAGFPGIPLKIIYPRMKLTLVESVGKKLEFCRHMVETLDLEDVTLLQARAEALGQDRAHREQYDWAVARAVANLPVLAEYLLPLVSLGGRMLAQKGESAHAEAVAAQKAIRLLGGELQQIIPVLVPGIAEERYLVVVDKVASTPPGYPRRVGLPARRPIQ